MPQAKKRKPIAAPERGLFFVVPGTALDNLALTAVVRDLPQEYKSAGIEIQTFFPHLWNENPHCSAIHPQETLGGASAPARIAAARDSHDAPVEEHPDRLVVLLDFSSSMTSNLPRQVRETKHFLQWFAEKTGLKIGLDLKLGACRGDFHLFEAERNWKTIASATRELDRYWLLLPGGAEDSKARWWDYRLYQQLVDHFSGRIQFVQAGLMSDWNPELKGTIKIPGTSPRGLLRLLYGADGYICGPGLASHLAGALPQEGKRAGIILSGGWASTTWHSYPGQDFIHTLGALPCCRKGACWRNSCRQFGEATQDPDNECLRPVELPSTRRMSECMQRISLEMLIERVEKQL